jgi:hypothetical protein
MQALEIRGINFIIFTTPHRQFSEQTQNYGYPGISKILKNYNPLRPKKVDGMETTAQLFPHPQLSCP